MAEETRTQSNVSQTSPEPDLIDLETGSAVTSEQTETADTSSEELERLRQENSALTQQLTRQRQQNAGAQAEARRLASEVSEIRSTIQTLQAGRSTTPAAQTQTQTEAELSEEDIDEALNKWINNDKSGLTKLRRALSRPVQQHTQQSPDDIRNLVRTELVDLGTRGNLQGAIGRRHPEMANPQSPLSQAIWEQYDQYAADPETQLFYPTNEKQQVPMIGPDGTTKMVDARVVDRMCAELKLSGAVQEGRRQESHDSTTGQTGTTASSSRSQGRSRFVEPVDLFTPTEMATFTDPRNLKGWPQLREAHAQGGDKAVARFLYQGMSEQDKAKRLSEYRNRQRGIAS